MKKFLLVGIFIVLNISVFSQSVLTDLENYSQQTLPNGMKIVVVQTKAFKYIQFRVVIDFHPGLVANPAVVELWANYNDFEKNGSCQLFTNKVSQNNAIDSIFFFFRSNYFSDTLNNSRFARTKQLIKRNIETRKHTIEANRQIARKFIFGKKSIYAQNFTGDDIENLTVFDYKNLYKTMVIPSAISIAVVGDVAPDTVFKYANKIFSDIPKITQPLLKYPDVRYLPPTRINFVDDSLNKFFTTGQGIKFYYTDKNFWTKQVLFNILKSKVTEGLPEVQSLEISAKPVRYGAYVAISASYKPDDIYDEIVQSVELFRDLIIYPVDEKSLANAKTTLVSDFQKSLKNPFKIAEYAYILANDGLSKNYFTDAENKINSITSQDIMQTAKEILYPDNLSITISGSYKKMICKMYSLANQYSVYFYDGKLYKYKIIPQGFGCDYIFNTYLQNCGITNKLKYLHLTYNTTYYADTIYLGRSEEFYRNPDKFFYVSRIYLPDDTLLQIKQIFNADKYYQKDATGEYRSDSLQLFAPLLWGRYLFIEKYYDKIGYEYEFFCDTNLIQKNIFKVKITTPYNLYFYDYYNFDRKEKDRTEIVRYDNGKADTVSTIFYTNYREVSRGSNVKLPYTIQEHRKGLSIDMSLEKADVNKRIKKSKFIIPKEKKQK